MLIKTIKILVNNINFQGAKSKDAKKDEKGEEKEKLFKIEKKSKQLRGRIN